MNSSQGDFTELKRIAHQAMIDHGLAPDFPGDALAQMDAIARTTTLATATAARDLRHLPWASIDNDDSRDLDQLSVAQPQTDGAINILVAIADVDAVVARDTPIDAHARDNTTSVYTAAQIFPMLPAALSTDLTSLAAAQDRQAVVIEFTVAPAGDIVHESIYGARVHNYAKLAYDSVAAWLDGTAPAPPALAAVSGMDQQIRIQDRVAQQLKRIRHGNGALSLETDEAQAVFKDAVLCDLRADRRNRAHELIEELMIAANGVTARYLEHNSLATIRRVLRTPRRWDRIVALAAQFSERLPSEPDALALNRFLSLRRSADPARFADLSLAVVKLLGAGEYALKRPGEAAPGHFGLAVSDYTHSTAPNRRFPDLILQRQLKAALSAQAPPYEESVLAALAAHCTAQEANAAKVERQVRKSAAALLLASQVGRCFDAIVTGAADKGTWVRIFQPLAEGRVVRGFQGMDVGDRVQVRLVHTDLPRGFIDFARA